MVRKTVHTKDFFCDWVCFVFAFDWWKNFVVKERLGHRFFFDLFKDQGNYVLTKQFYSWPREFLTVQEICLMMKKVKTRFWNLLGSSYDFLDRQSTWTLLLRSVFYSKYWPIQALYSVYFKRLFLLFEISIYMFLNQNLILQVRELKKCKLWKAELCAAKISWRQTT